MSPVLSNAIGLAIDVPIRVCNTPKEAGPPLLKDASARGNHLLVQ
jgi:hypothetical protein